MTAHGQHGFDFLGVDAPSQHAKERAAASGRRALEASRRIAVVAPKLAAAVAAAGRRAVAAAGAKASAAPSAASPAKAPTTKPAQVARQQAAPVQSPQASRQPSTSYAQASRSSAAKRTRVGDDAPDDGSGDAQAVDVYATLADTAAQAADFISQIQAVVNQLPQDIALAREGLGKIRDVQVWFVNPIEKALSGDVKATPDWIDAAAGFLQTIAVDQKADPPENSFWNWMRRAAAYLKVHPPAAASSATPRWAQAMR